MARIGIRHLPGRLVSVTPDVHGGGTAPAQIWRDFMVPARPKQSPLPDDWSNSTRGLRELAGKIEELIGDFVRR